LWIFGAKLPVYEVSTTARVEVLVPPHTVSPSVEGRVVASQLRVGLETLPGDVLLTLDGESVSRMMDETSEQIVANRKRLVVLKEEIETKERAVAAQVKARELASRESQAQLDAAQTRGRFARQRLQRAETLAAQNAIATEELDSIRSEAETAEALSKVAELTIARGEQDRLAETDLEKAELSHVQQEAARIEGDLAVSQATLRRLEHELELRSIRAYVAGRVEEVVPFRVGSVVKPAEKLATIVPHGETRIIAQLPVVAVGRVLDGQPARLRMDGFPWTQYGTLSARVTGIGNEPADGLIRVELAVVPDLASRIPLQHGQTGTVEIEVEKASPATLVLRAAGQYLTTRRSATGN
jgi:membrane fusion protein (multidrug efflux system)